MKSTAGNLDEAYASGAIAGCRYAESVLERTLLQIRTKREQLRRENECRPKIRVSA